jgi:hypothetical protein
MRPILALAILLFGLTGAAPEPEYTPLVADNLFNAAADGVPALVEIETSAGRGDRLAVADLPRTVSLAIFHPADIDRPLTLASASPDVDSEIAASTDTENAGNRGGAVSLGELCHALYASALDNDLPIQFFANLIWQESRLRDDAVSPKGALGIAQFMPKVASEKGLQNPLDPLQAIPASARFLRELRLQFGNLGFVAAAYNAGARRVAEWLEHRGSLPRETRSYVVRVTGLSVDAWRSMPVENDALTFVRRLPCRSIQAFADVEQTQLEQTQMEEAKLEQAMLDEPPVEDAPAVRDAQPRSATHRREPGRREHAHEAHRGGRERHAARHEARHMQHAGRAKHRSV